jgi:hypothetical protein
MNMLFKVAQYIGTRSTAVPVDQSSIRFETEPIEVYWNTNKKSILDPHLHTMASHQRILTHQPAIRTQQVYASPAPTRQPHPNTTSANAARTGSVETIAAIRILANQMAEMNKENKEIRKMQTLIRAGQQELVQKINQLMSLFTKQIAHATERSGKALDIAVNNSDSIAKYYDHLNANMTAIHTRVDDLMERPLMEQASSIPVELVEDDPPDLAEELQSMFSQVTLDDKVDDRGEIDSLLTH